MFRITIYTEHVVALFLLILRNIGVSDKELSNHYYCVISSILLDFEKMEEKNETTMKNLFDCTWSVKFLIHLPKSRITFLCQFKKSEYLKINIYKTNKEMHC